MTAAAAVARRAELAERLAEVRGRIVAACRLAGRDPESVTLIVVTKTFPAADTLALMELGVQHVGESRDQQARVKAAEVAAALKPTAPDLAQREPPLCWHFVGQLQRNKLKSILSYSDVLQAVDRPQLVAPLAVAAQSRGEPVSVLLQVELAENSAVTDPARAGIAPDRLLELAELVAAQPQLRLRGLMAVAPRGISPERPFAHLAELSAQVRQVYPQATWLSAGMSADLEAAVRNGATHVRVGGAILGNRPRLG